MGNPFQTLIGNDIQYAADCLSRGQLVAIPTETVYGLAANAFDADAVNAIFSTKRRPTSNPLILHIAGPESLSRYVAHLPDLALKLLDTFSPGPLTLLLPKNAVISDAITAGHSNVAIRIPNHPLTLALLKRINFPLVAPSANLYQQISPTTAQHVFKSLEGQIPYILDGGQSAAGIESTIVGFIQDQPIIYRLGAIAQEDIESIVGHCEIYKATQMPPAEGISTNQAKALTPVPGMALKHYSPNTPLKVVDDFKKQHIPAGIQPEQIAYITYNAPEPAIPLKQQFLLCSNSNWQEAAHNLYDTLHQCDQGTFQYIFIKKFPHQGLAKSLNDRIQRAQNVDGASNAPT